MRDTDNVNFRIQDAVERRNSAHFGSTELTANTRLCAIFQVTF